MSVFTDAEVEYLRGQMHGHRFPNFADECLRIRPTRIVSWGMEGGTTGRDFRPNARSVRWAWSWRRSTTSG